MWHTTHVMRIRPYQIDLCFSDRQNSDDDPTGWHGKRKNNNMNINTEEHSINWSSARVLHREQNWHRRKLLEALKISNTELG